MPHPCQRGYQKLLVPSYRGHFTANCYTFINRKCICQAKPNSGGQTDWGGLWFPLVLTVMYIFSLQPWPQSRQVIVGMMGRGAGPLLCMAR